MTTTTVQGKGPVLADMQFSIDTFQAGQDLAAASANTDSASLNGQIAQLREGDAQLQAMQVPSSIPSPAIAAGDIEQQWAIVQQQKEALGELRGAVNAFSETFKSLRELASQVAAGGRLLPDDISKANELLAALGEQGKAAFTALKNEALRGLDEQARSHISAGLDLYRIGQGLVRMMAEIGKPQPEFDPRLVQVDLNGFYANQELTAFKGINTLRYDEGVAARGLERELGADAARWAQAQSALAPAQQAAPSPEAPAGLLRRGWEWFKSLWTTAPAPAPAAAPAVPEEQVNQAKAVIADVYQTVFDKCEGMVFRRDDAKSSAVTALLERCAVPLSKADTDLKFETLRTGISQLLPEIAQKRMLLRIEQDGVITITRDAPKGGSQVLKIEPGENGRCTMSLIEERDGKTKELVRSNGVYNDTALKNAKVFVSATGELDIKRVPREDMIVRRVE